MSIPEQNPLALLVPTSETSRTWERTIDPETVPTRMSVTIDFLPASMQVMNTLDDRWALASTVQRDRLQRYFRDARHYLKGELYLTMINAGIASFNCLALRTLPRNRQSVVKTVQDWDLDIGQLERMPLNLEPLRQTFLQHPASPSLVNRLIALDEQNTAVYRPILKTVGTHTNMHLRWKFEDTDITTGFDLARKNGMKDQMLYFHGIMGTSQFDSLEEYMRYFGAIMKSNFPDQYQWLTWEEMQYGSAHYGLNSTMVEVADTDLRFKVVDSPHNRINAPLFHARVDSDRQADLYQPISLMIQSDSPMTPLITQYVEGLNTFNPIQLPGQADGTKHMVVCCPHITRGSLNQLGLQETLE